MHIILSPISVWGALSVVSASGHGIVIRHGWIKKNMVGERTSIRVRAEMELRNAVGWIKKVVLQVCKVHTWLEVTFPTWRLRIRSQYCMSHAGGRTMSTRRQEGYILIAGTHTFVRCFCQGLSNTHHLVQYRFMLAARTG